MEIKDSGNRRQFETGAVRDIQTGKGRMDLLPWAAIMEVSKHCENGALKYGEHNVDKGIWTHSFFDSATRHLAKYMEGWDDEPHLIAAAWNILWAIETEIKHPELKGVPYIEKPNEQIQGLIDEYYHTNPDENKNIFRGVPDEEFFKDYPITLGLTEAQKAKMHEEVEKRKTKIVKPQIKIIEGMQDE